jgi:hypothetical protein
MGLAVAQVELFNNSSWDLWTQNWQVRLVPVTQYDDWAAQAQAGAASGVVAEDDQKLIQEFLSRLSKEMSARYSIHWSSLAGQTPGALTVLRGWTLRRKRFLLCSPYHALKRRHVLINIQIAQHDGGYSVLTSIYLY